MTRMMSSPKLGASFRDPSGFLFTRQGVLYRQVNRSYAEDYERLSCSRSVCRSFLIPMSGLSVS
jgi:hypothetical protein